MLEKSDIEAIAREVFSEFGLNWRVFYVPDVPDHRWWVRARLPDLQDVFADLYASLGSREIVKKSLEEAVKRKLQELDSK